jgi:hypothetical protein
MRGVLRTGAAEEVSEVETALEFHDSVLTALSWRGNSLSAVLDAYLHRSAGRPGIDPGTGWQGLVRLSLEAGEVQGRPDVLPLDLWDGAVEVGGKQFDNCLPIPSSFPTQARVTLVATSGRKIVLTGTGLDAILVGEATYVDEFPGREPSDVERP